MRIDQWNPVAKVAKLCNGLSCDPALYNRSAFPDQWRRFVLRHRAQVLEVLTKYGEIVSASLDMSFPVGGQSRLEVDMCLASSRG